MQIIGLQIDKPFLRVAAIRKERSRFKICSLQSSLFSEPENVKQLYMSKRQGCITSGLSSKSLMIRPMELNIGSTRHLETALLFQYEGMHHLNPIDVISVPHAIQKFPGKVQALLCTVPREFLKAHLEECEKISADLDCVSSQALALIQYIQWKAPSLSDAILVDLGSSEWTCLLMEKRRLKKTYVLNSGIESLLAAFWEDRKKMLLPKEVEGIAKQIDLTQIKPHLNPCLFSKLGEMRQEIAKAIFSFQRTSNQNPIVFTGQIDAFRYLKEYLFESCTEAVSGEFKDGLDLEELKYAIPIGLAIEQTGRPLQLLRQNFFPKKNWRRAGLFGLILLSFSVVLSCLILCLGFQKIEKRKLQMIATVQEKLVRWGSLHREALSKDKNAGLDRWIAMVEAHRKEYPYILQAPRVAEVLTWISCHPLLLQFKIEKDPIDIQHFHYQLIEYPTIGCVNNCYRAKVEMEFKIKSLMNARKFHEALLQGDNIVDSSGEISWEMLDNGYKASFFLKNSKSPYVP